MNGNNLIKEILMSSHPIPVVRMILKKDDMILILKRTNTSHRTGCWNLPGGKVDFGNSLEEACLRELKEETNLNAVSYRFINYQDTLPVENAKKHYLNLYFEIDFTGKILLNEESSEYKWISPEEIPHYDLVFGNKEFLQAYMLK